MIIRTYQATDRDACVELFKSNTPRFFDPEELLLFKNWLNGKDKNENSYKSNLAEHFYVIEDAGKVIACGGFYIPEKEKKANMVWGMVHSTLHKKGFGKRMLQYRIDIIQQQYPDFSIILDTTQHSYSFFEKQGFKVLKITKDFYGAGLDRYDMVKA